MFLSNIQYLSEYINKNELASKNSMAREYREFSRVRKIYDQIRYINEFGEEEIRVNYNDGNPQIISTEKLQHKANRYYFTETNTIAEKEVYFSPFDLNIESGQIEMPLKPTIRVGTPVFDKNKNRKGIIIINYQGIQLLELLKSVTDNEMGIFSLLNSEGYYLFTDNPIEEWSFMYPENEQFNYQEQFPQNWQRINKRPEIQFLSGKQIITTTSINPFSKDSGEISSGWVLMNTISFKDLRIDWRQIISHARKQFYFTYLVDIIISLIILYVVYQRNKSNMKRFIAEEKLKDSEKRLLAYLENSPACTKIVDLDFNLNYMSQAGINALKVENVNDLYGKPYPFSYYPEQYQKRITSKMVQAKERDEILTLETPVFDSDGNEFWFDSTIVPVKDNSKKIDYLMVVSIDITERKISENRLREKEENLKITLNSIGDGVIAMDLSSRIINMNPVAERLTGFTFESAKGKQLSHIFQISNRSDDQIMRNPIEEVLKADKYIKSKISSTLISKDGTRYKVSGTFSPIRNSMGFVNGIVMVIRDVTEENNLLEQIHFHSKMESIGQLAGGVAHDFNNMLNGIISSAQLLNLPKRNLDKQGKKYVGLIMQASERAAELVANLLTFGRKEELKYSVVDLHQIIDETISITNKTIDKKTNITIGKNSSNSLVKGDRSRLQNVLLNLCINASHSMNGSGQIRITTEDALLNESYCDTSSFQIMPGAYCKICVIDEGSGIAEKNINKIFEPFYTTKEQGKGTGLGLASAYGTIYDHCGEISVQSKVGSGTTFTLFLPNTSESIEQIEERFDLKKGAGTVLVVDDEIINRILCQDILESLNFKVLLANDGLEAVDIYIKKHSEINIVLMDMIMPNMNGMDAFKKMKEINPNCKVIISSGFTRDESMVDLLQNGLSGFIKKPYSINELSKLLNDVNT